MTNSYSEDILVEQPAIALFESLGWETTNCCHEIYGKALTPALSQGARENCLGRGHSGEVVLTYRLQPALERLNPTLPPEALTLAIADLSRDRSFSTTSVRACTNMFMIHMQGRGVVCMRRCTDNIRWRWP